jgi:hypothetical protein
MGCIPKRRDSKGIATFKFSNVMIKIMIALDS